MTNQNSSNHYHKRNQGRRGNREGFQKRLAEVEKNYSILDVAQSLGLKIVGGNKCNCINPSHLDKSASMVLDTNTNQYHCYVCGDKGSNVKMVRLILEVTPQKAMNYITGKEAYPVGYKKEYKKIKPIHGGDDDFEQQPIMLTTQVLKNIKTNIKHEAPKISKTPNTVASPKPVEDTKTAPPPKENRQQNARNALFKDGTIHQIYRTFFSNVEPISRLNIRMAIFSDLDITSETLDKMRVGYISDYHKVDMELRKRFAEEHLVTAGLFGPLIDQETGEQKTGLSFFYHKIIFPFYSGNRIVFIQGRRLNNDEPIYLNTSNRVGLVYNFNGLRDAKKGQPLLITEGILNTLALVERGFNAVGMVGLDTWKKDWLDMVRDLEVCLAFPTNQDGEYLNRRLGNYFAKASINVKSAPLEKVISQPKKKNLFQPVSQSKDDESGKTGTIADFISN